MAKHTGGEWGVANLDGGFNAKDGWEEVVSTVDGCVVNLAEMLFGSHGMMKPDGKGGSVEYASYGITKKEAAANAKLMSAAPDLLDAVKSMLVCIGGDKRFYAEEAAAVAALKKAGVKKFGPYIK